jgi:hypothetical protein
MDTIGISNDKAITILNKPGIKERLNFEVKEINNGHMFLVNDRMLLVLIPHSKTEVEAHIGQPREHWPYIHNDIKDALIFIIGMGYNSVYTNVSKELKTTLNLLKKHDFKMVELDNNEVILKWESAQHL